MLALRALRSMTWRLKWWPPRKIWRKLPASGKSSPDLSSKTMAWLCIATMTFDSRRTALEADRDEYKRLYEKPGSWQNSQKGLRFRRGMCRFLAAHERAMAELEESQGTAEDQAALPATAVDTRVVACTCSRWIEDQILLNLIRLASKVGYVGRSVTRLHRPRSCRQRPQIPMGQLRRCGLSARRFV